MARDLILKIDWIGGNCPVQAEGWVGDKQLYFRARWDGWRVEIGGWDDLWVYSEEYGTGMEAGWIELDEAMSFIHKAVDIYRDQYREIKDVDILSSDSDSGSNADSGSVTDQ